jgi:hypothetical protein
MPVRLVHGRMQLGCGPDLALKGRKFGWNRGPALCFLIVGIAYLAGAAGAWLLITRFEHAEAAMTRAR